MFPKICPILTRGIGHLNFTTFSCLSGNHIWFSWFYIISWLDLWGQFLWFPRYIYLQTSHTYLHKMLLPIDCSANGSNANVVCLQILWFCYLVFAKNPEETCYCSCQIVIQHWLATTFNPPPFLASRNKKYGLLLGVYGIAEPLVRIGNTLALDLAFKGLWLLQEAGVPWLPDTTGLSEPGRPRGHCPHFLAISTGEGGGQIIPTPLSHLQTFLRPCYATIRQHSSVGKYLSKDCTISACYILIVILFKNSRFFKNSDRRNRMAEMAF